MSSVTAAPFYELSGPQWVRWITDEAVAAEQKGFTLLQISDSHVGFDKPTNPNVEYLAAI
jgi:hypothetical protein